MVKNKRKELDRCINSVTLFIVLFFLHAIWIFQGFDVTDSGFHLTNQVLAFSFQDNTIPLLTFLSDYVGGAWLGLWGAPNLLWARLGGVLIFCLTALISYFTLLPFFNRNRVFFMVLVSALLITMTIPNTMIDYYTFPALLLNLWLLFLSRFLIAGEPMKDQRLSLFMLGFLPLPIVLARLPLILIVFIIPLIVVCYGRLSKQQTGISSKLLSYPIIGGLTSIACFTLFFYFQGILAEYIDRTANLSLMFFRDTDLGDKHPFHYAQSQYDLSFYAGLYLRDLRFVFLCAIVSLALLYMISNAKRHLAAYCPPLLTDALAFIVLGAIFIICRYVFHLHADLMIALLMVLVVAMTGIYIYAEGWGNTKMILMLLMGNYIMFIQPIGSNSGYICRTLYGMWFILPLTLLLAYELKGRALDPKLEMALSLNTVIIILLIPLALYLQYRNIYRDDLNRFNLNTPFFYKSLKHVYSTKERVAMVDDVLRQITLHTRKGDKILVAGGMYMFYYLTATRPVWPVAFLGTKSLRELDALIDGTMVKQDYPQIIIFSKVNVRSNAWPTEQGTERLPLDREYFTEIEYIRNTFAQKLHYRAVWENRAFSLYRRF